MDACGRSVRWSRDDFTLAVIRSMANTSASNSPRLPTCATRAAQFMTRRLPIAAAASLPAEDFPELSVCNSWISSKHAIQGAELPHGMQVQNVEAHNEGDKLLAQDAPCGEHAKHHESVRINHGVLLRNHSIAARAPKNLLESAASGAGTSATTATPLLAPAPLSLPNYMPD